MLISSSATANQTAALSSKLADIIAYIVLHLTLCSAEPVDVTPTAAHATLVSDWVTKSHQQTRTLSVGVGSAWSLNSCSRLQKHRSCQCCRQSPALQKAYVTTNHAALRNSILQARCPVLRHKGMLSSQTWHAACCLLLLCIGIHSLHGLSGRALTLSSLVLARLSAQCEVAALAVCMSSIVCLAWHTMWRSQGLLLD